MGIATLPLEDVLRDVAQRRRTVMSIMEQALARLAQGNGADAFVEVNPENLRSLAARADRRIANGEVRPLEATLIAVKDLIAVRNRPMRAGTRRILRRPATDSPVIAQLRRRGSLIVGMTRLHELAFGVTGINANGTPLNPRYPGLIPGGSSSGSAAAVAAEVVHIGVGTDTGGSVRIPAACCAIVGFKPSFGAISSRGVMPLARSMDHVGFLARTADDLATFWAALGRPMRAPRPARKIGIPTAGLDNLDPVVADRFQRALQALLRHGFSLERVDVGSTDEWAEVSTTVLFHEAYRHHKNLLQNEPDMLGADVRDRLELGRLISRRAYESALERRAQLGAGIDALWNRLDLLASPTLPIAPLPLAQRADDKRRALLTQNTRIYNLIGGPAISLPLSGSDAPVGLQIAGARGKDDWLVAEARRLARLLEIEIEPGRREH